MPLRKRTPLGRIRTLRLATWCLVPINLDHPLWTASTVRKEIYVRGYNPTDARMVAAKLTATTPRTPLPRLPVSPWLDGSLTIILRDREGAFSDMEVRAIIDRDSGQVHVLPEDADGVAA